MEAILQNKTGYKETKLGLIPKDWEVCSFADIADKKVKWSITGGPFGSDLKSEHYTDEGVRIIQLQNIGDGKFLNKYKIFTSEEKANQLLGCNIFPGDLILSKMGDPVTRTCVIPDYHERYVMGSDGIRLVPDKERFDKIFVLLYLNYSIFRKIAIANSTGSTRQRIGLVDLKKLPFIQPPFAEQQKIAKILTAWDKAIRKLEQLIKLKEARKKGLMQQLLTGKKRFSGFTEKWKEVQLGEMSEFRRGSFPQPYGLKKWYDDINGHPFVQVYDVSTNFKLKENTKRRISELAAEQSVFAEKGTIVLTIQGSIGRIAKIQYDAYVDRTLLIFQKFKFAIDKYYFMMIIQKLFEYEEHRAVGGTIKTITKEKLSKFKIHLPSFEEQQKIASILYSADKEIENLNDQLSFFNEQKKGLMQKLLTGELRVKI